MNESHRVNVVGMLSKAAGVKKTPPSTTGKQRQIKKNTARATRHTMRPTTKHGYVNMALSQPLAKRGAKKHFQGEVHKEMAKKPYMK